jgi:hypothetical protein
MRMEETAVKTFMAPASKKAMEKRMRRLSKLKGVTVVGQRTKHDLRVRRNRNNISHRDARFDSDYELITRKKHRPFLSWYVSWA